MRAEMSESFVDFYKQHSEFLEEIFIKAMPEDGVLLEGNLRYLLMEGDLDQPDVEALRTQTEALMKFLQQIITAPLPPSAESWFEDQIDNVSAAQKFVMKLDLTNPKAALAHAKDTFGKRFTVASSVAAVALIDQLASGGISAMGEALALIARNLDGKIGDDIKLIAVPEDTGLTQQDIADGIKKAFDKSVGNKFSKTAKSFLKKTPKIPGATLTDFPVDTVMPELMQLTLPKLKALVAALPVNKIPPTPTQATQDALAGEITEEEAAGELSTDQVGKAAQAWLDKLKADGADASLMKIGKAWIAAVAKDPDFKKLAGLQESYRSSLTFLLFEQVKWSELVAVFSKNKPKMFSGLNDKTIEPLIAPFAQALADQGIEVVDNSGNPYKPPTGDTDAAIEEIEDEVEPTEIESPKVAALAKKLSAIKGIIKPEVAAQKIRDLFGLGGDEEEAVVEEGYKWSLYDLLAEKVLKYGDVVKGLADHLPTGDAERIEALSGLHDIISTDFGKDFGIAEIPPPPVGSDTEEIVKELEAIHASADEVPPGISEDIISAGNAAAAESIAAATGMDAEAAANLLDPSVDPAKSLAAVPEEVKEDPEWFKNVTAAAKARTLEWFTKSFAAAKETFGDLAEDFGEGVADAVASLAQGAQNAFKELSEKEIKELLNKTSAALTGGKEEKIELVKAIGAIAGENAVKEALPEKLANAVLGAAETEDETPEVGVDKFYEYENSKGKKIFVKVVEDNPKEGWWQAVQLAKDGKSWKKDHLSFAAKEASFGEEVAEEVAFGEEVAEVTAKTISAKDIQAKISPLLDDLLQNDELRDFEDQIKGKEDNINKVIQLVAKDLFAQDFTIEESLRARQLLPFLFEEKYTWADVSATVDKHAANQAVSKELAYAVIAKAAPAFQEFGVDITGMPEDLDLEALATSLASEPEEPEDQAVDLNAEIDIDPEAMEDAGISDEDQTKLDAEADKLQGELGTGPIDKNKLASILKKYPDIVGQGQKATRARRKLRKAINMAAGTEVFAENFDYGWIDKDTYLLTESDEHRAMARWRKLAGIKD